jgi:hypothetical protein
LEGKVIRTTRKKRREKESRINFFGEFIKVKDHFFRDLAKQMKKVKDPRNPSYIKYGTDELLFPVVVKNACGIISMSSMTEKFNKDECISNMAAALGYECLEELPHYDTINNFLSRLEPEEIGTIRDSMIRELFRKRSLEGYRLFGKYWCIAVDATQLYSFSEKHCEHCLKKEYRNKDTGEIERTVYYHTVLEAKLIIGDMVFSIATEFVENEDENASKQDCELNAFKRLAGKLKKMYPKLPVCLLGDSLYACGPVFEICEKNNWRYLFRFKDGRIKTVAEEFHSIKKLEEQNRDGITWVNGIGYNGNEVNMAEAMEEAEDGSVRTFVFITDIRITKRNAGELVSAGRSRWKIENEGFNSQKTWIGSIEHACSRNCNAMKNHYLIVQIAEILRQLYVKGASGIKDLNKGIMEISSCLLESFRTRTLTNNEDISKIEKRMQIRFS